MINDNSTGYWDYSNEIAPQWIEYGSPGAAPKPGTIPVGGSGNASPVGAGGMPVGGANPILSTTPPQQGAAPPTAQFTPNPFMTPGMTFQPRTQFGQQASAPLNLSQQGRTYGQMQGGPNTALRAGENPAGPQYLTFSSNGTTYVPQQLRNGNTMYQPSGQQPFQDPRDFQSVRPGGPSGPMPQFQNPFGPQPQPYQPPEPGMSYPGGSKDFYNRYPPGTTLQPQFQQQTQQPQQYRQMGQQPTQISQQPLQQAGLPALMREYRPGDNLVMSSNGVRIP